ncbi:MAG: GNAT family N-acetyltransferase [Woeseiaceae bacterium]
MGNVEARICVGEPGSFLDTEIDDFVAFVLAGGEVTASGLRDRVNGASHIAYARENECLLGVGGLKKPGGTYRRRIEVDSGAEIASENFPFELGWVFVLPSARGRGLSTALCRALVAPADGKGVFATSRTDNEEMHRTMHKFSFKRVGNAWPSTENDAELALFIRDAV